jgi:hypothetical protein
MGRKTFLILSLVIVAILIGLNIYITRLARVTPKTSHISQPVTIIPPVEASEIKSMDSPDGKKTLVMKKTKAENGIKYSFSVSEKEIFTKIVDSSVFFSIPYNTWSPDNKYIFLKETEITSASYFVLSVSTDSFTQDDKTANITDLFAKKYPDLKINDVTGWGGINLVIVNADYSYWFEMPSKNFIRLSTRF